jgi:hypothetical protein
MRAGCNGSPFDSAARRLLTLGDDGTARVWSVPEGRLLTGPLRHEDVIVFGAFSPDGKRIVTTGYDGTARIWDAATGRSMIEPLRHGALVMAAEFSPDQRWLATVAGGNSVRVWDLDSGQALAPPMLLHATPHYIAFLGAEGPLLTVSDTLKFQLWELPAGRPLNPAGLNFEPRTWGFNGSHRPNSRKTGWGVSRSIIDPGKSSSAWRFCSRDIGSRAKAAWSRWMWPDCGRRGAGVSDPISGRTLKWDGRSSASPGRNRADHKYQIPCNQRPWIVQRSMDGIGPWSSIRGREEPFRDLGNADETGIDLFAGPADAFEHLAGSDDLGGSSCGSHHHLEQPSRRGVGHGGKLVASAGAGHGGHGGV